MDGKYVLGELIGAGGMGLVYIATQPALQRTVAIKILRKELIGEAHVLERFRREALVGARIQHPGLVTVLDVGETADGRPFLAMEYVRGRPLLELARDGALTLPRICEIVAQVLAALAEVHGAGVVHADVKCDNVLIETAHDGRDRARLLDFGLAHIESDVRPLADPTAGTVEYFVSGTPEYLAPEVIRGAPPTPASDVYGVGVLLYELLTGTPPFAGGSAMDILARHLSDAVVLPSLRQPERYIPRAIEEVVVRALAKDPRERFADADAFAVALAAAAPPIAEIGCPHCGAPISIDGPHRVACCTSSMRASTALGPQLATEDWRAPPDAANPRRRTARASRGHGTSDHVRRLREAIAAAIRSGKVDQLADGYLALASFLVKRRDRRAAIRELEEGVTIATAGGDPSEAPPGSPAEVLASALAALRPRHRP